MYEGLKPEWSHDITLKRQTFHISFFCIYMFFRHFVCIALSSAWLNNLVFEVKWCAMHVYYYLLLVLYTVYPEPVYGVERELTPRRQRQQNTQILKANHYRLYS